MQFPGESQDCRLKRPGPWSTANNKRQVRILITSISACLRSLRVQVPNLSPNGRLYALEKDFPNVEDLILCL